MTPGMPEKAQRNMKVKHMKQLGTQNVGNNKYIEGGVCGDGEECDVTVTQKHYIMERSPTEFAFNLLSNSFF